MLRLEVSQPVAKTLFGIASNTKLFTATAMRTPLRSTSAMVQSGAWAMTSPVLGL